MTIFGVKIYRPTFWALTSAVLIGVTIWSLLLSFGLTSETRIGAGANLTAIVFGCVCNTIGIDIKKGARHLVLNLTGCVLVLILYQIFANLF